MDTGGKPRHRMLSYRGKHLTLSSKKCREEPFRNGNGHTVHMGVTQWKITRVFAEHDDALINRKLPRELLLRVFSYLDVVSLCRSAQVSKPWNILALDGSNWQRVDLFNFQVDIEGEVWLRLSEETDLPLLSGVMVENLARRCGGFLKSLSLNGCQVGGNISQI